MWKSNENYAPKCVYVRSFRGADCDTDHYLVIAKVRERLAVGKQAAQKSDRQRFNLRKLNLLVPELFFLILVHPVYKM